MMVLRESLTKLGWIENKDLASTHWDFKFGLTVGQLSVPVPALLETDRFAAPWFTKERIVSFWGNVGAMCTKLGLQRAVEGYTHNKVAPIMGIGFDL